jgi:hypothetical protein
MYNKGYVKISRSIQDHYLWTEKTEFDRRSAWIDLIMLANYKEGTIRKRGIKITILRGQVALSERQLTERWGWSRGKVKRFLNELEYEQQIIQQNEQQNKNVTSLITIINYDERQENEPQNAPQNEPQNEPQTDHKQNHKQNHKQTANRTANSTMTKKVKKEKKETYAATKKNVSENSEADLKKQEHNKRLTWMKAWFIWSAQELTGGAYVFTSADGVILDGLLKSGGYREVLQRCAYYLTLPEETRFPHGSPTVKGFGLMFNQLAGKNGIEVCRSEGLLPPSDLKLGEFVPWKEVSLDVSSGIAK